MRRREFITLLGGAAIACAFPARAQPYKLPIIGLLGASSPSAEKQRLMAFIQRLQELGWIEGHNIAIEYRWAEGRNERFAALAAELVQLNVNVIVTSGTPAVLAAKRATSVIPVVFASAGDPLAAGLATSLARPGGNITGLSNQSTDLVGKRLELLHDVVPNARRLAVLINVSNRASDLEMDDAQAAARNLDLEVIAVKVREVEDITPALEQLKGRADALYVIIDWLLLTHRARINALALHVGLPTMHGLREYVVAGGLMSYGPNVPDLYRRAAEFVDKILRGSKPGEIPIEQPTKFDLVINLKTAQALGLTVPPSLLARADEVIE